MVIGAVSVEGEDGGMEEIQGCGGGPGIAYTRHLGCRLFVDFGLRGVWDWLGTQVVRITDFPLERVSEQNHELGWVDDNDNGSTSRMKRVRKRADNPDATPPSSAHLLHSPFSPQQTKVKLMLECSF